MLCTTGITQRSLFAAVVTRIKPDPDQQGLGMALAHL